MTQLLKILKNKIAFDLFWFTVLGMLVLGTYQFRKAADRFEQKVYEVNTNLSKAKIGQFKAPSDNYGFHPISESIIDTISTNLNIDKIEPPLDPRFPLSEFKFSIFRFPTNYLSLPTNLDTIRIDRDGYLFIKFKKRLQFNEKIAINIGGISDSISESSLKGKPYAPLLETWQFFNIFIKDGNITVSVFAMDYLSHPIIAFRNQRIEFESNGGGYFGFDDSGFEVMGSRQEVIMNFDIVENAINITGFYLDKFGYMIVTNNGMVRELPGIWDRNPAQMLAKYGIRPAFKYYAPVALGTRTLKKGF